MKTVQIRQAGDIYKAAPNNYNRTKSAFGAYFFPAAELDARREAAKAKGYEVEIVANIARVGRPARPDFTTPEIHPQGCIDAARGVLKTVTTEYVIDCVTCRLLPIQHARFIGVSKGLPYWIEEDEDIAEVDVIYPSVFGDKKPKDFPRSVSLCPRK